MEMLNQSSRPRSFVYRLRSTVNSEQNLKQSNVIAPLSMRRATSQPLLRIKQVRASLRPTFGINESQASLRFEENPNNPFSLVLHKNSPD